MLSRMSTRAFWRALILLFLFSTVVHADEAPKAVHDGPGDKPRPQANAPVTPKADYCSPDFQFDLRYFPDPKLAPLIAAIERAQHQKANELYREVNGGEGEAPKRGWIGLQTHLTRGTDKEPKADDKRFASWALYLTLAGPNGLHLFDERQRGSVRETLRGETNERLRAATAPEWLKALPLNTPKNASDVAPGVDWRHLLNDDAKIQALYQKLFPDGKTFPPAEASLADWRARVHGIADLGTLGLEKLSYFDLTVLKEHLLNRFDAFSSERVNAEWQTSEDANSKDPARNYLVFFPKPKPLSKVSLLARREAERKLACVQAGQGLRDLNAFSARYSGQVDARIGVTADPSKWRRHGLSIEQRTALIKNFHDGAYAPNGDPLQKTDRGVELLSDAAVANLTLRAIQDWMRPDGEGKEKNLIDVGQSFVDPRGSLTPSQALVLLYNSPGFSIGNRWASLREQTRPPNKDDKDDEKKRNQNLDTIDGVQPLVNAFDRGARAVKVTSLEDLLAQNGRKISPEEHAHLLQMPEADFAVLHDLLHEISGVEPDAVGVAYVKQLINSRFTRLFGKAPVGRAELIKGLDFLGPNGALRFDPARMDRLVLFPRSANFAFDDWASEQNRRTVLHFAGQVRDEASARKAFPSREKLFGAFQDIYQQRYGRALRADLCPEPCDLKQPPSDKEVLAVGRLMRMEALADQHPEIAQKFAELESKSVQGLKGRELELTQRAVRIRFEHDLLEAELKRVREAIGACEAKGGGNRCLAQEITDAKTALWRQLYQDLERQRADLAHEVDDLGGKIGEKEALAVVQGIHQTVTQMQAMLAKEASGHLVAAPRVETGVAFDRKAFTEGNVPMNAAEKRVSSEEGGTRYALAGYVDVDIPCEGNPKVSYKLKDVPEEVLRSPEIFYAYLKRRATIETLRDGGLNDTEIDEVLTAKHELIKGDRDEPVRRKLYWDYDRLKERFLANGKYKVGNGYFALDDLYYRIAFEDSPGLDFTAQFSPKNKGCPSFDTFKRYLGWLQLVRGDSRHAADYRNFYQPAEEAMRRLFHIDDGRRVKITYQTAPDDLKAAAAALEAMDDEAARAEIHKLATGDANQRKRFQHLLSYFDRYPDGHPLRGIVMGPSVPQHLQAAFNNDPCLKEKPKTRLCLRDLWESATPEFQQREHTLLSLGLHNAGEKPEDLEKRLKAAAREGRRQVAGGNGGLEDDNLGAGSNGAGPTKGFSLFRHEGLIHGTVEHWIKRAIESPDDNTFRARLAAPQVFFDAVEGGDGFSMSTISALHESKAFFLMNLLEVQRLLKKQPGLTGLSPEILALVKGEGDQPDPRKLMRMEQLLRATVLQINGNIQGRGGALQDPAVVTLPPDQVLKAELENLEKALHGPGAPGDNTFERRNFQRSFNFYLERLNKHYALNTQDNLEANGVASQNFFDPKRWSPPPKIVTSEDEFLGLRQCDYFLFLQNGKHAGFKYNGIPPGSRVLIQKLSPMLRDVLEELCTYYWRQPNFGFDDKRVSLNPAIDKAIAETILGAWPGKVLSTLMAPENGILRTGYATRLNKKLGDRLLFYRYVIEQQDKERAKHGFAARDLSKDPEYRILSIMAGERADGAPWSTIAGRWPMKGLSGLIVELPTMKREDKEKFLQWAYTELIAQYPDVEKLRKLPPAELQKLLLQDLKATGGEAVLGRLDLDPKVLSTGNAAKPLLVFLINLINESGNNLRGTEAAALEQTLGGAIRFSPMYVALQASANRAEFPLPPEVQAEMAPQHHLLLRDNLRELDTQVWKLKDRLPYRIPAAERAQINTDLEAVSFLYSLQGPGLRRLTETDPKDMTQSTRDDFRKKIAAEIIKYHLDVPGHSPGVGRCELSPEIKARMEEAYARAITALDHADGKLAKKDQPAEPPPKGRWVKPERPVANPVKFSEDAATYLRSLGLYGGPAVPTRVCGYDGLKELDDRLKARDFHLELIGVKELARTTWADKKKKADAEMLAANPKLPPEVDKLYAVLEEMSLVGKARQSGFMDARLVKHLQPLGYFWGREDLTDPILKHPEKLADAGTRDKLSKEMKDALAAFEKSAPERAAMREINADWEKQIAGLYRSLITLLDTADGGARNQKIAQYVKDLAAAQKAYQEAFDPSFLRQRLVQLAVRCREHLQRTRSYLDGIDPEKVVQQPRISPALNKYLFAVGLGRGERQQPNLAAQIRSFHPASGGRDELVKQVAELKRLRTAWQGDQAARAELNAYSKAMADQFPKTLDQAIAYGEKLLTEFPVTPKALDFLGRLGFAGEHPERLRTYEITSSYAMGALNYPRAIALKAQFEAQRKQLDDPEMRKQLDALDPKLHGRLVEYHDHVISSLDDYAKSPKPSEDKALQAKFDRNGQLATPLYRESYERFAVDKLVPTKDRDALQKELDAAYQVALEAERQHDASDEKGVWVAEAPAPRPVVDPKDRPPAPPPIDDGKPLPPGAGEDPRPRQLAKILELLDRERIGLNDGQRQAILTRDPEANQTLLDMYEPMHGTLGAQGINGLPTLWRQLAQGGSVDDIREARMVLMPHFDEFSNLNSLSAAKLRQQIRDEIRKTGKLSPAGQQALQTLAQIEVITKWLPDRLKEVFGAVNADEAKTLLKQVAQQQQSMTTTIARNLLRDLRTEVAVDDAHSYANQIAIAYRVAGIPNPDAAARESVRNLMRLVPRDARESDLPPADAALLKAHPDFIKRMRTIYALDPVNHYLESLAKVTAESRDAELSVPPERQNESAIKTYDLVQRRFLPELTKATDELVKKGMPPSDAVAKAYQDLMQKDEFKGHGQTLGALRTDMLRESRASWNGAGSPNSILMRHLAVEAKQPRPQWCAEKPEAAWNEWDAAEKARAAKLEKSESAKQWEAFRITSRKRRDAMLAQQAEVMEEINRGLQEVQITSRKAADIKCAMDPYAAGCPSAGKEKKPDEQTDWEKMPEETRRQYRATLKAVESDLQVRREKVENGYRKMRELSATITKLGEELQGQQQELMQKMSGEIVRPDGYATTKQRFLRRFVDKADGTLNDPVTTGRAAWLERYFDWRDRADSLGRALAENHGPNGAPPNWEADPRVIALIDEVKDGADGCPVPKDKALALIRGGVDAQQGELRARKEQLDVLARYGIVFNGTALDFDDFKVDANDGKDPAKRFAEIKEALTRLGPLLPQGTKDPSLIAINNLLQGSPWQQFEERLLTKWNLEGRRPLMEWFNLGKITDPISGAAVSITRKPDGTFEFGFRPLQEVRNEASAVAKDLRKSIRDHEENLRKLRAKKNGFISWIISSVYDTSDAYHQNLDYNLAHIRPLADKMRAYGGISVEMEDEVEVNGKKVKKKLAPLPSATIADHSELEYVHEMKVSMDETMRNIAHDENWRIATVVATAAVATLLVASGVGVLAMPALVGAMVHGAAMGFGLALLGATWTQDVVPWMTGKPSDQTWSEIGPGAFKSAAVFSLGEGVAAAGGVGAEAIWGARLMRTEAPTGLVSRAWTGFGKIATNQTAQKMVGMGVTHFGIHQTWDGVEAALEDRPFRFWDKAGENALGGLQTGLYMWGPDQRAAGFFRSFGSRVVTSIAVNQTLSAGLNTMNMFRQFEKMESEARVAEADGTAAGKEKAKRIRAQLAESKKTEKILAQLGKAAFAELPTHAYFGLQAGKAAGMQGVGRDFMAARDPNKADSFQRLRERMAREQAGLEPGMMRGTFEWAWGKLSGRKRQPVDPGQAAKDAADARIGAIAAGQVPQYQVNQLVQAAKADPKGPAAEALGLLAAHYQMSPERFIEAWGLWSKNHTIQGSRPLGSFTGGQRARMRTEETLRPEERDNHKQSQNFLANAENLIERDIWHAQFGKDDAAREKHVDEMLAIRPDRLEDKVIRDNLPFDRLIQAAQQGVIGKNQERILAAMGAKFGMVQPEQMAHFFGGIRLKPNETLTWETVKSLVAEADYANPTAQAKLLRERRLSPEAMRGMFGNRAFESAIGQYLSEDHPTWDRNKFIVDLLTNPGGKTFFDFVDTYKP